MFRTSSDRRVAVADTALRFHRQAPWEINVTYDSFRQAGKIDSVSATGGSASPEDDRKWIAKDPNIRAAKPHDLSTYRFARMARRVIQMMPTIAIAHGARNAIATPIIRKLHMIAPALCASVRRSVASKPLSSRNDIALAVNLDRNVRRRVCFIDLRSRAVLTLHAHVLTLPNESSDCMSAG